MLLCASDEEHTFCQNNIKEWFFDNQQQRELYEGGLLSGSALSSSSPSPSLAPRYTCKLAPISGRGTGHQWERGRVKMRGGREGRERGRE